MPIAPGRPAGRRPGLTSGRRAAAGLLGPRRAPTPPSSFTRRLHPRPTGPARRAGPGAPRKTRRGRRGGLAGRAVDAPPGPGGGRRGVRQRRPVAAPATASRSPERRSGTPPSGCSTTPARSSPGRASRSSPPGPTRRSGTRSATSASTCCTPARSTGRRRRGHASTRRPPTAGSTASRSTSTRRSAPRTSTPQLVAVAAERKGVGRRRPGPAAHRARAGLPPRPPRVQGLPRHVHDGRDRRRRTGACCRRSKGPWDVALVPKPAAEQLAKKGYIPGLINSNDAAPEAKSWSGWSASGEVAGADGKVRRWVYLHYFKPTQPALNWLDPSLRRPPGRRRRRGPQRGRPQDPRAAARRRPVPRASSRSRARPRRCTSSTRCRWSGTNDTGDARSASSAAGRSTS